MTNSEISKILYEIAEYLEMEGVPFKPRAYEKAAQTIEGMTEELADLYQRDGIEALGEIPGVGASIAEKIEEAIKTGRIKYHEELKRKTPVKIYELTRVEGLGPKHVKRLYGELGIKDLADLERAAQQGKIKNLKGFGAKSEENILRGIEFLKSFGGRFLLGAILPEVRMIADRLRTMRGVERVEIAGSIRRYKETIGDADVLAVAKHPGPIMDYFTRMPEVLRVFAHGETKSAVKLKSGFDADLRVVPPESYGAALAYFTGSKEHNVAMREIAIQKGMKLNEYGLYKRARNGWKAVAGKTEEEIYETLGLAFVPPEMREMTGELEAAARHAVPKIIGYGDLRGDLQTQTNWTDGKNSIEEMARAAAEAGLEYIAITDHTKRLAMTGGLDEKRLSAQGKEIDALNKKLHDTRSAVRVLKGTECDILKDGSLDLSDAALAALDVVGISVHSHFNLSRAEQTTRIIRAMHNPHADILFHPTGRLILKRNAYEVDMDAIIKAAKQTGTVLEIDALPDRLDLKDEHIRRAVAAGVKLAIDSDVHSTAHFGVLEYGIAQARRGWATKADIVNTQSVEKMLSMVK